MSPNQAQRRSWNEVVGPKWAAYEAPQEASLQAIGARLLALAAVRPNDTVLEVGCGAGTLLAPLAAATGAPNRVTGIDISSTMLALARSRAPACVTLTEADAQVAPLGGPYDVIVSRFGLMFFADPDAAFTNLHAALAPRGRIAFVCWAALHLNPHWAVPLAIAARHLGPPPPPEASAPGPLAFADPATPRRLLAKAGFSAITIRTERVPLAYPNPAIAADIAVRMGPAGSFIADRDPAPDTIAAIRAEIEHCSAPADACVHFISAEREPSLAVEA